MKRELKVTLETVTPLFLGGAEQQPELRPASFRGVMRFWLRALLGGLHGDDLPRIKQGEAAVFGNASFGSPVTVRIRQKEIPLSKRPRREILPHDAKYLYWPLLLGDNRGRQCILDESKFEVVLQLQRLADEELLWQAATSLWLMVNLGGLGTRSRRLLGSLSVTSAKSSKLSRELPQFLSEATTLTDAVAELERGWALIQSSMTASSDRPAQTFCTLHPEVCQIAVVANDNWYNWETAAADVGEKLSNFRREIRSLSKRQSLGLPMKGANKHPEYSRYASPLLLSLKSLRNNELVCVAVLFKNQLEETFTIPFDSFVNQFSSRQSVNLPETRRQEANL